jgi:hypothetical protein
VAAAYERRLKKMDRFLRHTDELNGWTVIENEVRGG